MRGGLRVLRDARIHQLVSSKDIRLLSIALGTIAGMTECTNYAYRKFLDMSIGIRHF